MNISYETNGKAFMGWLDELIGSYVRGKTIEEANDHISDELCDYCKWLELENEGFSVGTWTIVHNNAVIEEGDSYIILDNEKSERVEDDRFEILMNYLTISAENTNSIYQNSKEVNKCVEKMAAPTFNGGDHSTIRKQMLHIISAQEYYLRNIGIDITLPKSIISCRKEVIGYLMDKNAREGNKIYQAKDGELWTITKVIRRIIWHDRFHAREINEMNMLN